MKKTYIHGHKAYPSYKTTGISWLGDVPEHWGADRLKQHVADVNEQTRERMPQDIYIALENIEGWTGKINWTENKVDFESQVKRFQTGDILFGKLRPYLAKVAAPKGQGLCVGEFLVLRSHQIGLSPIFLEKLLRSKGVIDTIDASTFGAKMPRADWNFIGSMIVPVPPSDEQTTIVRYLDDTDQRIRAYVSAKESLIRLLEEGRQAVIQQAVTRGLDPNVKLKPSGVESLGDIPEHWEVDRLKNHVANINDSTRDRKGSEPYIALEHVESWTGKTLVAGDEISFDSQVKRFQAGDVLFGKLRPYLAKVTIPRIDGICVGEFLVLRTDPSRIVSPYLERLMRSKPVIDTINASTFGAKMPRADWDFIGTLEQSIPPISEQAAIVEHLEKVTSDIDDSVGRARRQIELMEEYRTRLIADVVTGKLDVRGAGEIPPMDL